MKRTPRVLSSSCRLGSAALGSGELMAQLLTVVSKKECVGSRKERWTIGKSRVITSQGISIQLSRDYLRGRLVRVGPTNQQNLARVSKFYTHGMQP
jgi:hypothetical protein